VNVAVTGAAGLVGRVVTRGLSDRFEIRAADRRWRSGPLRRRQDTRRPAVLRGLLAGADAVVDLAGVPDVDASWRAVLRNNVPAALATLEEARRAGVRRVVYASSNHVTGAYEQDEPYASIVAGRYDGLRPEDVEPITSAHPIRPDGAYAIGKATVEAAARHYADAFGLSVICLRIGSVNEESRPTGPRAFATLLTHRDLVGLVEACLRAPASVGFRVLYGVSANTWRFWDLDEVRDAVGFVPRDDAEQWRAT
jgi:nucleoside-diphosphate-sugar epimerase